MFLNSTLQAELQARERLSPAFALQVQALWGPLANRIAEQRRNAGRPLVVGLCGPQGSGKSTGADVMRLILGERGLNTVVLALDDLYLRKAERAAHAMKVHPLLATRGPPGTHDVVLGCDLLDALGRPGQISMPRFDKAADDRAPTGAWPVVQGPVDVILFEGWCVGALPEDEAALGPPVNRLEADEDPQSVWRGFVNAALAGDYQRLFGWIDRLIQLRAPDFAVVASWRLEQEHKLRARTGKGMSDAEVSKFVQHYERLTRHIDREMPERADVVATLGPERQLKSLEFKAP